MSVPETPRRLRQARWWLVAGLPLALCGLVLAVCGPPAVLTEWWAERQSTQTDDQGGTRWQPPTGDHAAALLRRQQQALLIADEQAWLAEVDPDDDDLRNRYRQLYANLRGLGVTYFEMTAQGDIGQVGVTVEYCLGSAGDCSTNALDPFEQMGRAQTHWTVTFARRADTLLITGWQRAAADVNNRRPAPWETTPLVFASGSRVVVTAPAELADLLPQALAAAEQAAKVTDTVAIGEPPASYLIYLATADQFWSQWFGGADELGRGVAGYALPSPNQRQYEIVLRTPYGLDLDVLMRHEMTHAATLTGAAPAGSVLITERPHHWLVEGIAEYVAYRQQPATVSPRTDAVREFVAAGWTADLTRPANRDGPGLDSAIRYGLGHYAVACLAERYGRANMLDFFTAVNHEEIRYDTASQTVLGQSWKQVNDTCAAHIRAQLNGR